MKALFSHSMRIKKINDAFYCEGGISADVISRYVQYFGRVTLAVRIVESNENPEKLSKISMENVDVVDYRKIDDIDSFIKQFNVMILRVPSPFSYCLMKSAKRNNVPYIVECVGCAWDAYWNHSFLGKLCAPFMFAIEKQVVKNADYVLYVSEKFLQKRYRAKGKTIACSDVVTECITSEVVSKRKERIERTKGKKFFTLATIAATDVRYKGQQYVIKAIAKLLKKGYDFEYKIIGGGSTDYLSRIAKKSGVSDKVTFVGSVSHDKIFKLLDETDIYIQSSNTEGLPRALIEAMSRGCPIIGSSAGGIPELAQEGYVFKRKKVKDLIRILEKAVNSDFDEMSRYSFEKAKVFEPYGLEKKRSAFYTDFAEEASKK